MKSITPYLLSISFAFLLTCGTINQIGQDEPLFLIEQNGKYGYIDKTGKLVIKPQFDDADRFFDAFAAVQIGEKWGFIDKSGKVVLKPQFDYAVSFAGGQSEGPTMVQMDRLWGFVDKTGKLVARPQFDSARPFS